VGRGGVGIGGAADVCRGIMVWYDTIMSWFINAFIFHTGLEQRISLPKMRRRLNIFNIIILLLLDGSGSGAEPEWERELPRIGDAVVVVVLKEIINYYYSLVGTFFQIKP